MPDENDELLQIFKHEASELFLRLDAALLDVEEQPGARGPVDEFMRAAHTLKGAAGIAGLGLVSEVAHAVEQMVAPLCERTDVAEPELCDRVGRTLERLRDALGRVARCDHVPPELTELAAELAQAVPTGPETTTRAAPRAELVLGEYDRVRMNVLRARGQVFHRVALPATAADEPVAWATRQIARLRKVGTVVATTPGASELERVVAEGELVALVASAADATKLAAELEQSGIAGAAVTPFVEKQSASASARQVALQSLEGSEQGVRVELGTLGELLRLVGELRLARDRFGLLGERLARELGDRETAAELEVPATRLGELAVELEEAVLGARRVPVARALRGAQRAARDAARGGARTVRLEVRGGQTAIDRALAEPLERALTALVRAFAASAAASDAGRDAETSAATLTLEARRHDRELRVHVSGPAHEPAPEFVRAWQQTLAQIGGRLELAPHAAGLVAELSLPLTTAITRVLLARVGAELYAWPVEAVKETLVVRPASLQSIEGRPGLVLGGELLGLVPLSELLGGAAGADGRAARHVVVLHAAPSALGVLVDELVGVRDVVARPLGARVLCHPVLAGAAILGDGSVAFVLRAAALVEQAIGLAQGARPAEPARVGAPAGAP
ncbi:MAG: chemotaxis protein CheW [Myxococcales bacterium]|nr:chemotaxis protein CheW [Myxococcales bacterium]